MVPIALEYAAPEECPARPMIEAAIRERAPSVSFEANAPRKFAVSIERSGEDFVSALIVDDVLEDRRFMAHRCDDLVEALALVIALAVDPNAAMREPHSSPPLPPKPLPRAPKPWKYTATLAGSMTAGVSPAAMPVVSLSIERDWKWLAIGTEVVGGRSHHEAMDGDATFQWLAARSSGCALLPLWRIRFASCGHLEGGVVRASAEGIVNARATDRLWLGAGLATKFSYPMTSRSYAQLQIGFTIPFLHDRYYFTRNVTIHETANVVAWLGVGVGVRFR